MRRSAFILLITLFLFQGSSRGWTVTPSAEDLAAARQCFERVVPAQAQWTTGSYLKIVSQDVPDGMSRGRSWRGTPYRIGDQEYQHGIAFNASKRLTVHLEKPAKRFQAEVGLENNDDTQRGAAQKQGSVRFHVWVGGKEVFTSPVMRLEDEARRVEVPLEGADSFDIEVDDGGDGRGWDQALWAEAAVTLQEEDMTIRLQDLPWLDNLEYNPAIFSFLFGGKTSQQLLSGWEYRVSEERDANQCRRTAVFTDPKTKLEILIEAALDLVYPTVEWVIHIKNQGNENTPILEDIQALNAIFPSLGTSGIRLHWAKGGVASFDDFAPQEAKITPGKPLRLQPGGGRSSNQVMPFFNLEGQGGGMIAAVGWSGEWAAEFNGTPRGDAILKAGLAKTHLLLYPGEEIRTPRMLLLFYNGDRWRGQNLFRQYILERCRPLRDGKPLVAPITCGNWGGTSAAVHLDNIQKIITRALPLEYYWIDAEWYGNPGGPGSWAVNVGNWQYKKDLYPEGFKPLSDALKKSGRQLMLWFEPERVFKNTPWYNEHHDWLFDRGGDSSLLNLGNPEARAFLTDFISQRIDEFGLGCYRQDFNIDPLPFWQAADTPDRVGMSEIRYIEGLYAFWDELLRRHPDLIIDNCASGGRRIDIETIRRSTPFWRTDGPRDPIAHQCHTYGLLPWVPFSATSQDRALDDYEFRSSMCSALCLNWWVSGDKPAENIPDDFPFDWANQTLEQYLQYRQYYYGDYYPLTSYSQSSDLWMAYQLDRPDLGEGLVVVLKRPQSPYQSVRLILKALDRDAEYRLFHLDRKKEIQHRGSELLDRGLEIILEKNPDSELIIYRKVK